MSNLLDEDREFTIIIDSLRTLSGVPSIDGSTVVLTVEDARAVCIVEITQSELSEFIDELTKLKN
jgi:hypothetical protein